MGDEREGPLGLAENYAGVFGARVGFGRAAAVLVVDFINAYTAPRSPLYAPADLWAEVARRYGPFDQLVQVPLTPHTPCEVGDLSLTAFPLETTSPPVSQAIAAWPNS